MCILLSAAESNVKKVSLELGGKSPLIIFNDCDLDKAVRQVSHVPETSLTNKSDIFHTHHISRGHSLCSSTRERTVLQLVS